MWRYWLLLAMESLGELLILLQGVPAYRRVIAGEVYETQAPLSVAVWVFTGVCLIQGGYWVNHKLGFSLALGRKVVMGHVVLLLGRLNFIFFTGLYSVALFARYEIVNFTALNIGLLATALFSGFCYTLELERLGRKLGA